MPNSVQPCGQQPTRFLHPQDSPGKNTRVGTVPANWALWQKVKKNLIKVKKKSEKVGLKLSFQKTKTVASGPITSWQLDGEAMETVTDFIFLGSNIIADSDCSHEVKRHLLLRRKAMTNLDSILKSRDITLPTNIRTVKAMVFPVVMFESCLDVRVGP